MVQDYSNPRKICEDYVEWFNGRFGTKVRFRDKHKTWWMYILAVLVFPFNQTFMSGYITTIGSAVYFPKGYWDSPDRTWWGSLDTVFHECVHAHDLHKSPFVFIISYGFPQLLSLVFLPIAIVAGFPWWACLIAFFLPWVPVLTPSPGRCWWEVRGYRTSIFLSWKVAGVSGPEIPTKLLKKFTGSDYFWMGLLLKGWVRKLLLDTRGVWTKEAVYAETLEWMLSYGLWDRRGIYNS